MNEEDEYPEYEEYTIEEFKELVRLNVLVIGEDGSYQKVDNKIRWYSK